MLENKAGQPHLKTKRKLQQSHQIPVGAKLRAMMPWLSKKAGRQGNLLGSVARTPTIDLPGNGPG